MVSGIGSNNPAETVAFKRHLLNYEILSNSSAFAILDPLIQMINLRPQNRINGGSRIE